ncbi:MAG: methylamine utilization protein [Pseudomonadaceae bacterium]|nr:MAG: methylamine utilization protein [Pseudomonadaceae bacterium]
MAVGVVAKLALLGSAGLMAQTLSLQLTDAGGNPLSGAVVLLGAGSSAEPLPTAVMDQVDMQFTPHVLVVPPGTEVNFPNSDDVRHHVYSFSPAKRFELRLFKGSEAPPVLFDQPGAVVLGCNIHDRMQGYILVAEQARHAFSDSAGEVELTDLPAGQWPVAVWHPRLQDAPPVDLGTLTAGSHTLQVDLPPEAAEAEPELSPLQQRFRRAAGHAKD